MSPSRHVPLFGAIPSARRIGVAALLGASLLLAGSALAAPSEPGTRVRRLQNGAEIWLSPDDEAATASLRLELGFGLESERAVGPGSAAALLGGLLRCGGPELEPGELATRLDMAGITVAAELDWDTVAVTFTGRREALGSALDLLSQRLAGITCAERDGEAIRAALWLDGDDDRAEAVDAGGTAADLAISALFGDAVGPSSFASRQTAAARPPSELAALANAAFEMASLRALACAPEHALKRVGDVLARRLDGLPPPEPIPAAEPAADAGAGPDPESDATDERALVHVNRAGSESYVVGVWDLRGGVQRAGLGAPESDATLLTIERLLGHRGGPLWERVVDGHGAGRSVDVLVRHDRMTSATVEIKVSEGDPAEARRLMVDEVERLGREPVSRALVSGAAAAAAAGLRLQWSRPEARVAIVGSLARMGRIGPEHGAEGWLAAVLAGLERMTPEQVRRLAGWVLLPDRRMIVSVLPEATMEDQLITLDEATLQAYVRILADLSCPPSGTVPEPITLLEQKYGWNARRYLGLKRKLSRRPQQEQDLFDEVRDRCDEYEKLRSLASLDDAIALHEAVACQAGRISDDARRERKLRKIFAAADLDPSVYRPLIAMAREDMATASRIEAIDARCAPKYGPGAPR